MSEINEAESNLIHEVGNNEVESTITMSTSNDDRAESSIIMSVDPQEAESSITMETHDHEAESDLTNTTEEEPTSRVHKLDTFEDIEVENDATIGGTLRAHKIVVPLGEYPEENGKDIYSTGAAYKHSATYIEVDGSQSDSGLIGLTLVNAKGEALGKKVYIDTGISQAILKAIKEARAASKSDTLTISNGVVDMLEKYVRDEIGKLTLKYISKVHPDTAQEIITFLRGLYVGERGRGIDENGNAILLGVIGESFKSEDYRKGLVDGAGFGMYTDEHGKSIAEVDKLNVRQKATFAELEIRKFAFTTGDVGYTSAACKISIVKDIDNAYRCYFLADDGDKRISNDWHIGDQAICKTGNLISRTTKNASNRYYWRLVVNKGEETINGKLYYSIDLSNIKGSLDLTIEGKVYSCVGCDTSADNDVPQAEDSIIQLGSQTDTDRQYAYIVYVSEGRRVDYAGINDYDLTTHIINDFSPRGITLRSDSLKIISAAGTGISQALVCDRGDFVTGVTTAGHYDRFSYQGSLWLCIVGKGQTTTDPPSETSTKWLKQVARGERGAQGTNGVNGIAGKNGIDGKTSYLHIAYANSADGRTDFDISNSNGKGYIGTYTDFVQADSTDPTKYKWARIKGEDGANGTSEKTYIRYSDDNGATFTKSVLNHITGDTYKEVKGENRSGQVPAQWNFKPLHLGMGYIRAVVEISGNTTNNASMYFQAQPDGGMGGWDVLRTACTDIGNGKYVFYGNGSVPEMNGEGKLNMRLDNVNGIVKVLEIQVLSATEYKIDNLLKPYEQIISGDKISYNEFARGASGNVEQLITFYRDNTDNAFVPGKLYCVEANVKTSGNVKSMEVFIYDNKIKLLNRAEYANNVLPTNKWQVIKTYIRLAPHVEADWSHVYVRFDNNGSLDTKSSYLNVEKVRVSCIDDLIGINQADLNIEAGNNVSGTSHTYFTEQNLPNGAIKAVHVHSAGVNGGIFFQGENFVYPDASMGVKFSVYMRSNTAGLQIYQHIEGNNSVTHTLTPEWKRYEVGGQGASRSHTLCLYTNKAGDYDVCCPQFMIVRKGEAAPDWIPSKQEEMIGMQQGSYLGIASWDKNYPPLNPSAYTWSAFKGEDGKDAEIYRLKASKESAKVTADGLLICDAAYTIGHVQGTSVEVITSEGAAGNKPYVLAHTDKGVNVSVTAGANNTILYKLNGYFDLASRPDNIIVELYVKENGSAKIVDTRVIPILMEAMSYTRMVRDMRENISANGRDISTIRQTANSASVKVNNAEARLENGEFVVKSDTTKFVDADGQKKVLIKNGKVSAELIDTKQMVAEKMRTKPDSTGLSINIFGGVFEVITKYGQRGISLEVDGNGFPHLIFYGVDGRPKYDLGGDGLARMTDGVIPERWSTIKLSQASTLNDLYPHTLHDIIYHEHTAAYNNVTGTWGANAEYNDILFTDESFSSNRIADGIYTTAFDKNIDSLRPVYSEEALVAEDGEPQTKPTNESNRIYGKRVMRYHNGKMVAYADVLFKVNGNSATYCDKKGNSIQVESLDKYPYWQLVGGGDIKLK